MAEIQQGRVWNAGELPPEDELPPGVYDVTVLGKDQSGHWILRYPVSEAKQADLPNGFNKVHDANVTVVDLAHKIAGVFKGRYGVPNVNFSKLPRMLADGAIYQVEVK